MADKNLIARLQKEHAPLPDGFEARREDVMQCILNDCTADKVRFEKTDCSKAAS